MAAKLSVTCPECGSDDLASVERLIGYQRFRFDELGDIRFGVTEMLWDTTENVFDGHEHGDWNPTVHCLDCDHEWEEPKLRGLL